MKRIKFLFFAMMLMFTSCVTTKTNLTEAYDDGKIAGEVKADIEHVKHFAETIRELNDKERGILDSMELEVDELNQLIAEIEIIESIYNEQISAYEKTGEYDKINAARKLLIEEINSKLGVADEE